MDFSIEQLAKITGAEIIKSSVSDERFCISTDTRTITTKHVYIPLVGEKFDGHNYINSAIKSGVKGYFTQKDIIDDNAEFILKVPNTLITYLQLANFYKCLVNPKTIAITGSAGKTTTKEMMYSVFKQDYKTHKSELNHNNEIGLAQTLLSMPEDTEFLIVEMGMRGLGEIELLSKYAEPDVAVIANIGSAHIGRLGSIQNIAKAKYEITKYLNSNGVLITNKSKYIADINTIKSRTVEFSVDSDDLKIIEMTNEYSKFSYKNNKYKINISGEYNIQNALAVIEAAKYYGLKESSIQKGLEEFKSIQNRWQIEKIKNTNVINDAYNANPESMIATVKNFLSTYSGKKFLLLGDMGELGKDEIKFHEDIGKQLQLLDFDYLITVGKLSEHISNEIKEKSKHFNDIESCCEYLNNHLDDAEWILLKASRSMQFENIINKLKELCK